MKNFLSKLNQALVMLHGLEIDMNIHDLTPNEKQVFYAIVSIQGSTGANCNISGVVESSGLSRSSVYKTLKKLSDLGIITTLQSPIDKREFFIQIV